MPVAIVMARTEMRRGNTKPAPALLMEGPGRINTAVQQRFQLCFFNCNPLAETAFFGGLGQIGDFGAAGNNTAADIVTLAGCREEAAKADKHGGGQYEIIIST